jgi:porin
MHLAVPIGTAMGRIASMRRLMARKSIYLSLIAMLLAPAAHAQNTQSAQNSGPNANWADAYTLAQNGPQQNIGNGTVDPSSRPVGAQPASKEPALPRSKLVQKLLDDGVNIRASEIDQYAKNTTGGVKQGSHNVGQFYIGADFDLGKIFGWSGASFHFTAYRDYGLSLNALVTGTYNKQQYIYKNAFPRWHLGLFSYEQKAFDDRLDVQIGRLGSTTYFGHLVVNCQFVSANTCGEPRMLVSETGLSLLPSATWGGNVKFKTTEDTYVDVGAFEVNPDVQPSNGLDWEIKHSTGYTLPIEFGWAQNDPKTVQYPFELKGGVYESTAPLTDINMNTKGEPLGIDGGKAATDNHIRDGFYVMGDKVIWRPDPDSPRSFNVFGGWVQQLEDQEIMHQQIYTGFVMTGPFSFRPYDTLGLNISEFEMTPEEQAYLAEVRKKEGGTGVNALHQTDYDLTYSIHLVKGLELMPSLQYIVHPDNSSIPKTSVLPKNLFVYAISLRVDIGVLMGFRPAAAND